MDLYTALSMTASFVYLAISLSLAAITSLFYPHYFSSWVFLIVILFALTPYLPGVQSGLKMKSMAVLMAICALILSSLMSLHPALYIVYLAILAGLTVLVREYEPLYAWPVFVSSLLVIVLNDLTYVADVLLAAGITLLVQLIIAIIENRRERQQYFHNYISELKQLTYDVFDCFLDPDYSHNIYIFEQRLHRQKMKCLKLASDLQVMMPSMRNHDQRTHEQAYLIFIETLYQHIQNVSILRWRVTDYTAFSLCVQELKGIVGELGLCLDHVWSRIKGNRNTFETTALTYWIGRLDDNYHNVLQVAAREPLVFALFVDGLFSLRDALNHFYGRETKA